MTRRVLGWRVEGFRLLHAALSLNSTLLGFIGFMV